MYEHLHIGEPWSDDGGEEWNILITGQDPSDHIITVHSKEGEEIVKRQASFVVMAIQTYTNAQRMMGEIMGLPDDKQADLFSAIAARRLMAQAATEPIQMRGPRLAPTPIPVDNPVRQMIKDALKPVDNPEEK